MAFSRGIQALKRPARSRFATLIAAMLAVAAITAIAAPSAFADDPAVVTINQPAEGSTHNDSSAPPPLDFSTTGDVETQECKYDNTAYHSCARLAAPGLRLTNGAHSYSVRTLDTSGTASVEVVNFTIADSAPPAISAAVAPNGVGDVEDPVTSPLAIDVTTDDSNARLYASIDAAGNQRLNFDGPTFRWVPSRITNGTHTAYFIAIDGAGQQGTAAVTFTLDDHLAPSPVVINPMPGATLPVGELYVEFDAEDPTATFRCQLDTEAPQRCFSDTTLNIADIGVGAHTLTVHTEDNVGNTGSSITSFSVTDSPVAGMSIAEPMDGANYTAQPLLQLNLTNPIQDYSLRCSVNGGRFYYCAAGDPILEVDHNGSWTVKVRAIDDNGDQVSDTASFTVDDTTPPQVDGTPPPGPISDASGFLPDFTIADAFADASASYFVMPRCQLDDGPMISCIEFFGFETEPELSPGAHTITMTAFDWVGNSSAATIAFTITDTTAPVVQILAPVNNYAAANDSFTVDFVATGGFAKLRCQIGSGPQTSCESGLNDGIESWSPEGLVSGANTLTVYATDVAGNTGSDSINVNVTDATGPSLNFISPAASAVVSDAVVARILSGEQIFKLRCAVDAAPLAVDDEACWISESDPLTATFRPDSLATGTHTLWVEGSDNLGNTTLISRVVDVQDTTAPDLTIEGFNNHEPDPTNDSPLAIDYSSSDPSAHFTCSIDGATAVACGAGGQGFLALDPVADGAHAITVNAIDPSGNTTSKTTNYTVNDTTAPYLWIEDAYDGMAVGTAVTTHPQAVGASSFECAVDAAAFASCSPSGWTANFATSGTHVLRYRASDVAGNSIVKTVSVLATVPVPPVTPPVTVPDPTPPAPTPPALPSATAKFAAIKPKVTKKAVTIPLNIAVALPVGVNAASACSGKATVSVKVGKKVVKSASVPLKLAKGKCAVTTTLKLKPKAIAGKKFTAEASFAGNGTITKFYSAKTGKTGRAK